MAGKFARVTVGTQEQNEEFRKKDQEFGSLNTQIKEKEKTLKYIRENIGIV